MKSTVILFLLSIISTEAMNTHESGGTTGGRPRKVWTSGEDEALENAVKVCGTKWTRVAGMLPKRNARQCRERWMLLDPNVIRSPWSPEEDDELLKLHSIWGNKWAVIAAHFFGRAFSDVKNRWECTLKHRTIGMGGRSMIQENGIQRKKSAPSTESEIIQSQNSLQCKIDSDFSDAVEPRPLQFDTLCSEFNQIDMHLSPSWDISIGTIDSPFKNSSNVLSDEELS